MNEVQTLIEQIAKHWGWEVGDKVRQEIEAVISAQNVDIDQLQAAIQTIQSLLDADPNTEEFDVGQNIVTQLSDHLARISSLETDVAKLKGDETVAGSVAYAVKQERDRATAAESELQNMIGYNASIIETLNGDETVEGSVSKKVKDAVETEKAAREAADANLQAQIDELSGGSGNSIATVKAELDATQAGAGLEEDGSYTPNTATNYIDEATSLKDADEKLDAAIKELSDRHEADKAAAQAGAAEIESRVTANENAIQTLGGDETVDGSVAKTVKDAVDAEKARAEAAEALAKQEAIDESKAYADATFVTKDAIANISAATLASIFRQALDCGFGGASKEDVLNGTGDCTAAGDNGGDNSDGAVL
ncbi:hypothetical protein [Hydrogenimonas sp.]